VIDTVTYNKARDFPQRHGYQVRGTKPSSIVIHSTSNRRATSFTGEATYLYTSAAVGAHYLVGKAGQIVQFLDPSRWQAWHAGEAITEYTNPRSIGIELHISVGEQPTTDQIAALTTLVRDLMARFSIPPERIETHRAIALPRHRKNDPEGFTDAAFSAWRNGLSDAFDPFARWGLIGYPQGDARGWAVARAWLMNKKLGACVAAETYLTPDVSFTVFEMGTIRYFKPLDRATVEMFL
jgi:uncharacterized MAPEG superfamily protein